MNCVKTLWYFSLINPYSYFIKYNRADVIRKTVIHFQNKTNFSSSADDTPSNSSNQTVIDSPIKYDYSAFHPPWRIIFFGNDDFSLKTLQRLNKKYRTGTIISELAVVSTLRSVVARFAEYENLTQLGWPLSPENYIGKFDVGVVVSFGHMIPEQIIDAIPLGILNVHGSLLPRWRGAAPIHYAIINGDTQTGVTIMRIHANKYDTGEIVHKYKTAIRSRETTPELRMRLATSGADLLMTCIKDLTRYLEKARPQPTEGITYAPRVTAATARIHWNLMTATDVYNLQRGIGYLYAIHAVFKKTMIRFFKIEIDRLVTKPDPPDLDLSSSSESRDSAWLFLRSDLEPPPPPPPPPTESQNRYMRVQRIIYPGGIVYHEEYKKIKVQCKDGSYITIGQLCMSGKRPVSGVDFYNGYLSGTSKSEWRFY